MPIRNPTTAPTTFGTPYARYILGFPSFQPALSVANGLIARVYLTSIQVPHPIIIDRLGYMVGTVQAGNIRVGLYRDGTVADAPAGGALVVESASVAQTSVNSLQLVTVADTLVMKGLYWFAWQCSDATATAWMWRDNNGIWPNCYTRGGGYGAFTNPCPATAGVAGDNMLCLMRVKTNLPLT